jgi:hypothetical protein
MGYTYRVLSMTPWGIPSPDDELTGRMEREDFIRLCAAILAQVKEGRPHAAADLRARLKEYGADHLGVVKEYAQALTEALEQRRAQAVEAE